MPAPRVILLAGAPSFASVDRDSCTVKRFSEPFLRFLNVDSEQDAEPASSSPPSCLAKIAWRSLPATRRPLHTGFSQNHEFNAFARDDSFEHRGGPPHGGDFFTTAEVTALSQGSEGQDAESLFTRFCEESLTAAAGRVDLDDESLEQSITFEETSLMTSTPELNTTFLGAIGPLPISAPISDLRDIPSASHITALNPQTVTKNLIVAILSIAQPRAVTTRWGTRLSLIEVLVSDDTKPGFSVTFWLPGGSETTNPVTKLRRQDVILLENVALQTFRGKVYGQSLRRGVTKVSLLWRRDGSGYYSSRDLRIRASSSSSPQLEKTRLVKDWVIRFVGGDSAHSQDKNRRKSWDKPPDHSQD